MPIFEETVCQDNIKISQSRRIIYRMSNKIVKMKSMACFSLVDSITHMNEDSVKIIVSESYPICHTRRGLWGSKIRNHREIELCKVLIKLFQVREYAERNLQPWCKSNKQICDSGLQKSWLWLDGIVCKIDYISLIQSSINLQWNYYISLKKILLCCAGDLINFGKHWKAHTEKNIFLLWNKSEKLMNIARKMAIPWDMKAFFIKNNLLQSIFTIWN